MREVGARRFWGKILAANDNSKNQIYLGAGFGALNVLPHGAIEVCNADIGGAVRQRSKANLEFRWISPNGITPAPHAQMILYPRYPEVRLSGLLRSSEGAPSNIINSRHANRVIIFGVTEAGYILAYAAEQDSAVSLELAGVTDDHVGVFIPLDRYLAADRDGPREALLREILRIHRLGAITGQKLHPPAPGTKRPYKAKNAGGMTLEAEFGILPNSISGPDFEGWELKAFLTSRVGGMNAKNRATLLTPAPTRGLYCDDFRSLMDRYGYQTGNPEKGRRDLSGSFRVASHNNAPLIPNRTGLRLVLSGYDFDLKKIVDMGESLRLIDSDGNIAADWKIADLVSHWSRKHAQAAYVPYAFDRDANTYSYSAGTYLGTGTDPIRFLSSLAEGAISFEPGLWIANKGRKQRHQFRVLHRDLEKLYDKWERVVLP